MTYQLLTPKKFFSIFCMEKGMVTKVFFDEILLLRVSRSWWLEKRGRKMELFQGLEMADLGQCQ